MTQGLLVVDASAVIGWLMPDEAASNLDALARDFASLAAPWLLWAEVRNMLVLAERKGRVVPGLIDSMILRVERLGIRLDMEPDNGLVLSIARQHGLTVYDALYLDLAVRTSATLATLDRQLASAAVARGVPVV